MGGGRDNKQQRAPGLDSDAGCGGKVQLLCFAMCSIL